MVEPVRWGVLGVAGIAVRHVIPAMDGSPLARVEAIASRVPDRAKIAAEQLGIPRWHGSYEELLADPEIEAVYIPLPNHLHKEWAIAAVAAGKHVLCEKPMALTSADAEEMVSAAEEAGVALMEAFMYRLHPMWRRVLDMVRGGSIGELLAVQSFFSYHNVDPGDIRNQVEAGGGALYDIGCYPVNASRLLFGSEPIRVSAAVRKDPRFGTDVVTSAVLEFTGGHATFTCSTQLEDDQRVHIHGTEGRILVEIPFNIPPDRPTRILVYSGGEPPVAPGMEVHQVPGANQYRIQAEEFSQAVRERTAVPTPPGDAVANLRVIERILAASAQS